jgi:hypothetical protein
MLKISASWLSSGGASVTAVVPETSTMPEAEPAAVGVESSSPWLIPMLTDRAGSSEPGANRERLSPVPSAVAAKEPVSTDRAGDAANAAMIAPQASAIMSRLARFIHTPPRIPHCHNRERSGGW